METPKDVTKEQLISDLTRMRSRITELERYEEITRKFQEELTRTKAMFEGLFEFAPDAIIVVARDGRISRVNMQAEKLFGYSRDELLNLHHEILLPERFRERHERHRREYMSGPRIRPMGTGLELYGRRKEGTEFSVDIALGPLKAGDDIVVMAVIRDVSERKLAEDRYRNLFNAIDEGFCIIEVIFDGAEKPVDYRFLEVNPSFEKQTGLINVQGKRMRELAPEHEEHWFEIYGKIALTGKPVRFQNRAEQLHRWYDVFAFRFGRPEDRHVAVLFNDITEHRKMEEEISHMARHDALTGLPNRRFFVDLAHVELAQSRRNRKKAAVLFLDLDRFKEINDVMGHETGDALLKEVAARLKSRVRESDTVARIGGDEFNILLSDINNPENVVLIARKIIDSLRKPYLIAGHEFQISASIGISLYSDDAAELDTLLRYADIALYYAKEQGRNNFQFYNPAINVRSLERMRLESSLLQTLEHDELEVYYQPQVDMKSGAIVNVEALVRWRHPEMGLLEPKKFLSAAEETGFISAIDKWVLRTAGTQAKSWLDAGLPVAGITVNLSARHFQDPELVKKISEVLKETGLPADHLEIEITETIAMSNIERTIDHLNELVALGIHVSIDDFGTGYSSLNYLKRLPIQKLKIDRLFVRDIATDTDDRAIVQAVIAMAHTMKMKVVAEGVETEEQLEFLRKTGCDEMQGYLFSRPLPADKFRELIAAG